MISTKKGHNVINELQLYVLTYSAAQLQECLLNLLTYLFTYLLTYLLRSDREFAVTGDWHTKLNPFCLCITVINLITSLCKFTDDIKLRHLYTCDITYQRKYYTSDITHRLL